MIDLHVHSNRSDGTFAPKELVDYAMQKGLTAFALTDHDCVEGLEEAIRYAKTLPGAPAIIPGVELSTEYKGRDVHIVGLNIDYHNPQFVAHLQHFVASRVTRNEKMCSLLQDAGIDISYKKLMDAFPGCVITRAHYGQYLMNHGYVKSMNEAFDRYIGDRCPYYVPREKVTPAQAVDLILGAGGIPVLAHPVLYRMSDTALETLVAELKEHGLIGIEVFYSTYTPAEERQMLSLAAKYRLLPSGGSDFHGSIKPDIDLGTGKGRLYVDDSVWTTLQSSQKKALFSDMDGTLLLNNSTISENMKKCIGEMTAAGHHLILSSGRPLPSILEVCELAGLNFPNMLILSNNGALVYDCDQKRPILEHKLQQEDMRKIIALAKEAHIHIHGYTTSEIVCYGENDELRFYTSRIHMPLRCVADIADALPQGSYKLQCIHLTDRSVLERFREQLLQDADLASRVQMFFSNDQYLEILPAGADKGSALAFITDHLPILRTNTFAAGDAENDITMLDAAHIGIAMLNATDKVKAHSDIITAKSNNEDGLIDTIREYILA